MNARGVLAFMACILIGGVVQAAPVLFSDDFNYETQQDFDAAWPMVYTSSATGAIAQTMTLRMGDGSPADPLEASMPEWNQSIGGTGPVNYNKRNYHLMGGDWGNDTIKAVKSQDRQINIDFWYYDTHSTGYGRQFIEFRDYNASAASSFPVTVPAGLPSGYNYILAFGPYTTTTVGQTNYFFRSLGYGTSAWRNSGLVRSVGWHHFKISIVATSATGAQIDFWDITNPSAPVHATTNQTLNAVSSRGIVLNHVTYGGGTLTSNTPVGFDGWLDNLRITPEPVSLALLGLGSLLLRRRRA